MDGTLIGMKYQKMLNEFGSQKYVGVGGHLFAIAADKSIEWGYEGAVHGFAANAELLKHYMDVFHAEYLGMLHQYQFFIDEEQAKKLLEVYHYEWNEAWIFRKRSHCSKLLRATKSIC